LAERSRPHWPHAPARWSKNVRVGLVLRRDEFATRRSTYRRKQPDVYLIVVIVGAHIQRRPLTRNGVGLQVLRVYAFLQARIVLLDFIAERLVGQEESEIRPEVEHRAPQETVYLEDASVGQILPVVGAENTGPHAPAVLRVDETEAIQHSLKDFVEWNLSKRKEVVVSEVELEAELLILIQPVGVVARDVITLVVERILERPVGPRAFISDQRIAALQRRAVCQKCAERAERPALETRGDLIRQRLLQSNVDDAEAGEIAVFRAERAVEDVHVLDEFGSERFQLAEIALPVSLRALILLHVVHENLQTAVHAPVVEVEAEAADFARFAASLVLPPVKACVERMEDRIVTRKEGVAVDGIVAAVDYRIEL